MKRSLIQNRVKCQGVPRLSDALGPRLTPPVNGQGLPRPKGQARLKKQVQNVRVATLNVGSMTGRSREIAEMMNKRRVDALCVQEIRWRGDKAKEVGGGCKLLYSGADENGRGGVGIVLNSKLKEDLVEVERKSSRIMRIKIMLSQEVLNVVSAYAPQAGCDDVEKERFWREMDEVMTSVPAEERVLVGGDLNGHIGTSNRVISRIHGGLGMGDRNEEGETIIDFALAFDMALVNTFFTKKEYVTYRSGGKESQIDFILCRRKHLREAIDCKVINGEYVSTQHKLLVTDLKIRRENKGKQRGTPKIKWWKLEKEENVELRSMFKEEVLREIRLENNVDDWWNINSQMILKIGEAVLGKTSGKGLPADKESWWWNEEIQGVIKKKTEARKNYERQRSEESKQAYKEAKKIAKREVARSKAVSRNELYENLETPEGQRNIHKIAKARNGATRDLTHIKQIKDANGTVLTRVNDIKSRWREYFENLLNEENPRSVRGDGVPNERQVPKICRREVRRALGKMKKGKAVGPDGIPVEVWRCLGEEGVDILWDLFNKIYQQEKIPEGWRNSLLLPIYKEKGDIQDCGNYRGIKLMPHTMKIYERVIEARIRDETIVSEEQFGFMPGRGTTDAIFVLRQVLEKYREKEKELHLVFIDLEKAYDRVPRQEVWRCLREKNVSEKYVRVIKDMYKGATTQVRSVVGTTEQFEVKVGLHQGSTLSPYIFDLLMDVIVADIKDQVPWSVLFADDVVLVTRTREEAERKLEMWRRALEDRGLKISRTKTEYLWFNGENQGEGIKIEQAEVKRTKSFKYLGSYVTENGDMDEEISQRIKSAWYNWKKVSGVLCDNKISARLKGKVYKSVVRPALLYSSETWPMKRAQERRMEVAEMRMLRWMCGVTRRDRIKNAYIRGTVKVTEITKKMQERRLRWFGHVMRKEEESVCRRVMNMEVPGKRRRGRPKKRWKDTLNEDMREKDIQVNDTQDRCRWRRLIRNSDPI